jgi:uncharacterized membrane protein YidH (DUF202 family)
LIFGIVVFMVYMQHPEDKLVAWFPKAVVFLGLFLTCVTVLLVPFDVAIQNGVADQVFSDMSKLWFALFYIVAIWAIVVCPFTIFWYERDEDDTFARQLCTTICYTSIGLFVFIVITLILYYTIGFVELPLMLESMVLMKGAPNQATLSPPDFLGFFSNSTCLSTTNQPIFGPCPPDAITRGCVTLTVNVPTFSAFPPDSDVSGSATIQTCYFDHPTIKYSNLDRDGMKPVDANSPKADWISSGCAKACSKDSCQQLAAEQGSESLQRYVTLRHSCNHSASTHPAHQILQCPIHPHHADVTASLHTRHALLFRLVSHDSICWYSIITLIACSAEHLSSLIIFSPGFGLFLVPMDLINDWRNRPIRM